MKKYLLIFLCISLVSASLAAQHSETRAIDNFTKLIFEGNANLHLRQGDTTSLVITAKNKQTIDGVVNEIRNNTLHIHYRNENCAIWHPFPPAKYAKIDIYLTYTNIQAIELEGRIKFHNESAIHCDEFVLETRGHVKGDLEVYSPTIEVETDGYAKLKLKGEAQNLSVDMNGMGKLNAQDLKSVHCEAEGDGTVVLRVHASEELNVDIRGFAKIQYTGTPKVTDIDRFGFVKIDGE